MGVVKKTTFELSATENVVSTLKRVQTSFETVQGSYEKLQKIGAAVGVGLAVDKALEAINTVADFGDNLSKMSQRVGVSVESLSTLRYAAEMSGVGIDELDKILTNVNKKMGEAAGGSKEAAIFLKQFGITVKDIKAGAIDTEEAVKRMADRFASAPDNILKSSVAKNVSEEFAKMIPFLNAGREGIEQLQQEATKLGLKMSTETAQRLEKMNDQLSTLKFAAEGAKTALVTDLLPAILKITQAMRDGAVEGGKWEGVLRGIQTALTGDDQYKNDKQLVDLTEKKLQLERDVTQAQLQGNKVREITFQGELDRVNAQLRSSTTYAAQLRVQTAAEDAAAKAADDRKKNGKSLTPIGDAKAAMEELKLYQAAVQGLEEKLFNLNHEGEVQAAIYKLTSGSLKTLTSDHKAEILAVAGEIDDLRIAQTNAKSLAETYTQLGDRLNNSISVIGGFNEANSEKLRSMQLEIDLYGKSYYEQQRLQGLEEIRRSELEALKQVADDPEGTEQVIQLANAMRDELIPMLEKRRQLESSWVVGAKAGLQQYIDDVDNMAKATSDAVVRGFQSMEDALVTFSTTGKLDFKSLADSVIADLIRIQIRASVTGPLAKAMQSSGGIWGLLSSYGSSNSSAGAAGTAFDTGGSDWATGLSAYANGGNFTVGGVGGTDSQVVAFRASPNEEVSVRTPGQQDSGGMSGVTIIQQIKVDARSDQASIDAAMIRAKEGAKAEIADMIVRGNKTYRR